MTHTYNIQGMTCGGCKASVARHLSEIQGVTSVEVDLAQGKAEIGMKHHIPTSDLKMALPEKFTLTEVQAKQPIKNIFDVSEENSLSKMQQLKPLFLIFGCISLMTFALDYDTLNINSMMLNAMGLFFFVFSLFKFFDLNGFSNSFSMYDPLAKMVPIYGMIYPFIELVLGFSFLARFQIPVILILTIIVLGITTIGVIGSLLSKETIQCACLGTVLKLPMTQATFIENTIMIVMAVMMLFNTGTL
jgi:copper chaperone CopZ